MHRVLTTHQAARWVLGQNAKQNHVLAHTWLTERDRGNYLITDEVTHTRVYNSCLRRALRGEGTSPPRLRAAGLPERGLPEQRSSTWRGAPERGSRCAPPAPPQSTVPAGTWAAEGHAPSEPCGVAQGQDRLPYLCPQPTKCGELSQ